ncbi:hypothetical protein ScPMuIL_017045 [Solemya velum]
MFLLCVLFLSLPCSSAQEHAFSDAIYKDLIEEIGVIKYKHNLQLDELRELRAKIRDLETSQEQFRLDLNDCIDDVKRISVNKVQENSAVQEQIATHENNIDMLVSVFHSIRKNIEGIHTALYNQKLWMHNYDSRENKDKGIRLRKLENQFKNAPKVWTGVLQVGPTPTSGNLNRGTEFVMEIIGYKKNRNILLILQSEEEGHLFLKTLSSGFSGKQTFSAGPSIIDIVGLFKVSHNAYLFDTLHCVSSVPISLVYYGEQGDTYSVWPTHSLGNDYLVPSYAGEAHLDIVGVENDTEVAVTFRDSGEVFEYNLTVAYLETLSYTGHNISGSTVSSNKRIAVFTHQFTEIPSKSRYADHIGEQCKDTSYLGTEYIITPFRGRKGYLYRVFAIEKQTAVSIFGPNGLLEEGVVVDKGNHLERIMYTQDITIVISNKPVLTTVFAKSKYEDNAGEPAMTSLTALGNMSAGQTKLSTPADNTYHKNYMTVVAREINTRGLLLVNSELAVHMNDTEITVVALEGVRYTVYSLVLSEQHYVLEHSEPNTEFYVLVYGFRLETKGEGYCFDVLR